MRYAMYLLAFLCLALGVYPAPLYAILPFPVDYMPYTVEHVVSYLQLLLFAGLAFFVLLPQMKRPLTLSLDFDWLYRRLGPRTLPGLVSAGDVVAGVVGAAIGTLWRGTVGWLEWQHGLEGRLSRTWPTGSMVLWVSLLLAAFLLFTYADPLRLLR